MSKAADTSGSASATSRFAAGTGISERDRKAARLVGPELGRCLQFEWEKPVSLEGFLGEQIEIQRKAIAENTKNIRAADEPYHPYSLAGSYHSYRIANKFPVPGGTVEDDKKRRAAVQLADVKYAHVGEQERIELQRLGLAKGEAAGIATKRLNPVLRETDFSKLMPVVSAENRKTQTEKEIVLAKVPDWKVPMAYPLQPSDRAELFALIDADNQDEILQRFARSDIIVNGVDEATLQTGLMRCAIQGREKIMKMFVDAGADLNMRSVTGNTALHYVFDAVLRLKGPELPEARKLGFQSILRMVRYLVSHGANVNTTNMSGETPLHLAAFRDLGLAVKLLLEAGANMHHRRADGRNAVDIAYESNAHDALRVLKNWDVISFHKSVEPVAIEIAKLARAGQKPTKSAPLQGKVSFKAKAKLADDESKEFADKASVLTQSLIQPAFEVSEHAEKAMSADELVGRWDLMMRWMENKSSDALKEEDDGRLLAPRVKVVEVDRKDNLVHVKSPLKERYRGRVVLASRRLTDVDAANHGAQWFDIGVLGKKAVEKQQKIDEKKMLQQYDDDNASVAAMPDGAMDGEDFSRPATREARLNTAVRDEGEMWLVHNAAVEKVMSDFNLEDGPAAGRSRELRRHGGGTSEASMLKYSTLHSVKPTTAPPPSRAMRFDPALEASIAPNHTHLPMLMDAAASKTDDGCAALLVPSQEYDGYKRLARSTAATHRTKRYKKLVESAAALLSGEADTEQAARAEGAAASPTISQRRRQVALNMVADMPGTSYNQTYTHVVDGKVMTRRPAILSAALRPARIRADVLESDAAAIRNNDQDILTKLVVGVRPNREKQDHENLLFLD